MWDAIPGVSMQGFDAGHAAAVLAAALGCGLLIGVERERSKGRGPWRALAGLRSFALACVMGAAAMLSGQVGLVAVGALLLVGLGVVAHARDRSSDPGVTTEIALLLTYVIGVLCVWSLPLAAAMAVGTTALLAARDRLHAFAKQWLQPAEVRDGIILAALVLIAMPLMPDRAFWGPVLNPHVITQLLALLLAIQSLAHLSRRLLEARQAIALSSIASGFVSSTATIASMGMAVREGRSDARLMAGAGLLSCVATLLQVLVVAVAVQPAWVKVLLVPASAGAVVALLWGGWLVRGAVLQADGAPKHRGAPDDPDPDRMFSLRSAALVAMLLTGVQVLVYAVGQVLGRLGALAATMLASLVDLHSALAAVFTPGPPSPGALLTVMLALSVHACSKCVTAALSGGRPYVLRLAPGLFAHTAVCVAGLALLG